MNQKSIVRSHRQRVKDANNYVKTQQNEKINRIDREAIVEFFLLEDIDRLYDYRLHRLTERSRIIGSRAGEMAQSSNIMRLNALKNLISAAIDVAGSFIYTGQYKPVWQAIPEHALMASVKNNNNNIKYLVKQKEIVIELLRSLSDAALLAQAESQKMDESLDEIERHEKNAASVYGIQLDSIDAIIAEAEKVLPSSLVQRPNQKNNPNVNL